MVTKCYLKHFQVTNATEGLFIGHNLFFFDFFAIKTLFFDQMHFYFLYSTKPTKWFLVISHPIFR